MLSVVVQPSVSAKRMPGRAGELEEREDQRAEHRERHRAGEDDERIAERVELRREHQEDEDEREAHRRQELAALLPQLARLARVVDAVARRQDLRRGVLEDVEAAVERARRDARDLDRVELLEAVERARLDARRAAWRSAPSGMSWPFGPGDVDVARAARA